MEPRSAPIYQTEEWIKGDKGQKAVAKWLRQRGAWVNPTYDYCGEDGNKAPRLLGPSGPFDRPSFLIIPDLDVSKNGERFWVEVKTKKNSGTPYFKTNTIVQGFDLHHFYQYLQVEKITGTPVFVMFYNEINGQMMGNWLNVISRRCQKNREKGMIYVPIDCLRDPNRESGWEYITPREAQAIPSLN